MTDAPAAPTLRHRRAIDDLRVATAGHHPAKRGTVDRLFDVTGVGLVVAGRGTYRVDGGAAQPIEAGSFFPVYPGARFRYGPPAGESWEEHYLCVVGAGAQRWVRWGLLPTDGRPRRIDDSAEALEAFESLHAIRRRQAPGDADRALVAAERVLVALFHRRVDAEARPATGSAVERVLAHCERHYDEALDFRALARRYAMSYSSLRQQLRRVTGLPPGQYLTRLRCEAACRLLQETDRPVAEIGQRVGIPDPFTFSRAFKRCIGMSPSAYKRRSMH